MTPRPSTTYSQQGLEARVAVMSDEVRCLRRAREQETCDAEEKRAVLEGQLRALGKVHEEGKQSIQEQARMIVELRAQLQAATEEKRALEGQFMVRACECVQMCVRVLIGVCVRACTSPCRSLSPSLPIYTHSHSHSTFQALGQQCALLDERRRQKEAELVQGRREQAELMEVLTEAAGRLRAAEMSAAFFQQQARELGRRLTQQEKEQQQKQQHQHQQMHAPVSSVVRPLPAAAAATVAAGAGGEPTAFTFNSAAERTAMAAAEQALGGSMMPPPGLELRLGVEQQPLASAAVSPPMLPMGRAQGQDQDGDLGQPQQQQEAVSPKVRTPSPRLPPAGQRKFKTRRGYQVVDLDAEEEVEGQQQHQPQQEPHEVEEEAA